jgi:hypothetical protein
VLFLVDTKRIDLSLIQPPRNKESVFGRKQGSVAKVLDKRKLQKITEYRVIKIIAYAALSLW